jgi:hypothetical protein
MLQPKYNIYYYNIMNIFSNILKDRNSKPMLSFILFASIIILLYLVYNKVTLLREGGVVRAGSRKRSHSPVVTTDGGVGGNFVLGGDNKNVFQARKKIFDNNSPSVNTLRTTPNTVNDNEFYSYVNYSSVKPNTDDGRTLERLHRSNPGRAFENTQKPMALENPSYAQTNNMALENPSHAQTNNRVLGNQTYANHQNDLPGYSTPQDARPPPHQYAQHPNDGPRYDGPMVPYGSNQVYDTNLPGGYEVPQKRRLADRRPPPWGGLDMYGMSRRSDNIRMYLHPGHSWNK